MKRILLLSFTFSFVFVLGAMAQRTVSGNVTDDTGETVPGINVVLKGTTNGTTTDLDGNYRLSVPEEGGTLVFSFIGLATQEVEVGARSVIDVAMASDVKQLAEVVVTGVGLATDTRELSVSVAKVSEELLQTVPATDPASALRAKVAGVRVTSTGGSPGAAPEITLRGATSLSGSQAPLIIIDGVISEGSLADINAQDIESIEVVKGAAAASIYGSRAANGVVNISTKKGAGLNKGQTRLVIRNEVGQSSLPRTIDVNKSHNRIVGEGETLDFSVHQTVQPSQISDIPYTEYYDYQEQIFDPGSFYTNYVQLSGNSETGQTNYSVSYENYHADGVVNLVDGYDRQSFRVNLDNKAFNDKLTLGIRSYYTESSEDRISTGGNGGDGSVLFDMLRLPPNGDLFADNEENGQPYNWDVDPTSANEINPLYDIHIQDLTNERRRVMTNATVAYEIFDWLKVDGSYTIDNLTTNFEHYIPNTYAAGPVTAANRTGYYRLNTSRNEAKNIWANMYATKTFGKMDVGLRLSYLNETEDFYSSDMDGNNFNITGLRDADALVETADYQIDIDSRQEREVAQSFYAVGSMNFDGRYIVDGLIRQESSSLFGGNERTATFFRASGAWRISEDISIPKVQELKVRASYGTAGNRPPVWNAQYETFSVNGFKSTAGNPDLKREIAKEFEVGLNASVFDRLSLEFNYAQVNLEDLIVNTPLPSPTSGGYSSRWDNVGDMQNTVYELGLNVDIIKKKDLTWQAGVVWDRIRNKVTKLEGIPFLRTGPNPNDEAGKGLIYVEEGGVLGEIWGAKLMTSFDELIEGQNADDYVINSDGYLVLASAIGTVNEAPIRALDEEGNQLYTKIGDVNPDFNLGFNTRLTFKGLTVFAVMDWKQGGDVYNQTKQWMMFQDRHGEQDMSKKPAGERKPFGYYANGIYSQNEPVDYFVEDGTYVKLRELNVSYEFGDQFWENMNAGWISSVKVGVVGRNLLQFTGYTGYDPEVSRGNPDPTANNASSLYAYDGFTYPNMRTFSGYLTLTF
ncbi:MAG: SusC/RagA family TonB-linked outer membrane protein [Cyclobacteriaceae bacterium]